MNKTAAGFSPLVFVFRREKAEDQRTKVRGGF